MMDAERKLSIIFLGLCVLLPELFIGVSPHRTAFMTPCPAQIDHQRLGG